jgi:ribosomal protein S18 acetylase RimI-like enzyme
MMAAIALPLLLSFLARKAPPPRARTTMEVNVAPLDYGTWKRFDRSIADLVGQSILSPQDYFEKRALASVIVDDFSAQLATTDFAAFGAIDDEDDAVVGFVSIEQKEMTATAEKKDQLIRLGKYDAFDNLEKRPLLASLAVNPEFRKLGIGRRLCGMAESQAKSWGYNELFLRVEEDNPSALIFYRKLGYRVVKIDEEALKVKPRWIGIGFEPATQVVMCKSFVLPAPLAILFDRLRAFVNGLKK